MTSQEHSTLKRGKQFMMISFPGVMGPRDLPDVPLVDDNHQYETHRVVLATSRAESTLSQNTLSTLTY